MKKFYQDPFLSVLVLDFCKPIESELCLQSIKRHLKVPHSVIFCDNGSGEGYSYQFVKDGLVDQLIVNRDSRGLGLGTRDLFSMARSSYSLYVQNDQMFCHDLTESDFNAMLRLLGGENAHREKIMSISLAGSPCGVGVYSERAHLVHTKTYQNWEESIPLPIYGAGPYHDGMWREEALQREYSLRRYTHFEWPHQYVQDNGVFAVRDMKEGGLWVHRTDTKQLWNIIPPTEPNPVYPKLSDEEFELAKQGKWPDGQIPEMERADSFSCWQGSPLVAVQDKYIASLKERKAVKA